MREKIGGMKISKGVLAKVREAGVGPEEIKAVTAFCEETNQGLYRLGILHETDEKPEDERLNQIHRLETDQAKASFDHERELFQRFIDKIRGQIAEDEKRISLFRLLVSMLPEREKLVLKRLYEEGYAWSSVYDNDGVRLNPGSVQYSRNNGLALMAVEVSKQNMWTEINTLKGETDND